MAFGTHEAADGVASIAPRLRELRRRGGLTLETAARRVGLSPAHLSRLETGERQPSLPVLLTLSRAYGVAVSSLLGEAARPEDPIIRAADEEGRARVTAGGWTYQPVGAAGRALQALRVHIPHRSQHDLDRAHPGEEWLYVLSGRLHLTLGDTTRTLAPGDAAHYDSLTPHRLGAAEQRGTDLLFVHTLLQSPTADTCFGPDAPQIR